MSGMVDDYEVTMLSGQNRAFISEFTAIGTAHTRQNSSLESGIRHKLQNPTKKLLIIHGN